MAAQINALLTPGQVARLLQVSKRTIYAQSHRLGGFYPAGIRALRFREEFIYAIMEGPQDRQVAVSVPTPGPTLQQDRIRHPEGCQGGHGKAPGGTGDGGQDPTIAADAIRFGLRTPEPGGANGELSPISRKKPGAGHSEVP